ncbi:MAG: sigma 54-interacting transcriptional regulator [Desulfovibrionaceae bacterium]
MAEILFICPYPELAEIAKKACGAQDDVLIKVARMDEAVRLAKQAEKAGFQVIISRGLTASGIEKSGVTVPVVTVPIGGYDILRAYYQARTIGSKIGIVDLEEIILGISSFEEIVGETFLKYICHNDLEDITKGVSYLKNKGADVVIGKIAMARLAREMGMESVIITSGYEAVLMSIFEARRVSIVRKQEKKEAEQLKAIMQFTYDGIIALDKNGRITVFNRASEQISGWKSEKAIGRYVTDIIPAASCQKLLDTKEPELGEILELGDTRVVTNRVPIVVDNAIEGVVTTFQKIDMLQKLESQVRKKLATKGLVARHSFADIVGESSEISKSLSIARKYALNDSTILINGETGTGKDIFAQAIHNRSSRKNEPFMAINCAALPESILESELFGYVEGAFTGAKKGGKAGVFEMAHCGTLFLDEVGEMSPMLQVHFLRVIEQREVMRLGSNCILPVNVRIIAATHRNLKQMVDEGSFREDLYYRLNVLSLKIPQLARRGRDVLLIAQKFLQEYFNKQAKPVADLSNAAEEILLNYKWPGNIRELRNVTERLAMLSSGGVISGEDVKEALLVDNWDLYERREERSKPLLDSPSANSFPEEGLSDFSGSLNDKIVASEKEVLMEALERSGGSKKIAADLLGISRTTLWRKLKDTA